MYKWPIGIHLEDLELALHWHYGTRHHDEYLLLLDRYQPLIAYPNPVRDQVYLEGFHDHDHAHIRLLDLQGRVIQSHDISVSTDRVNIDMHDLSPGVYLLQVRMPETSQVFRPSSNESSH